MRKHITSVTLAIFFLASFSVRAADPPGTIWGLRMGNNIGVEAGLLFGDKFGVKAIAQSDLTWPERANLVKSEEPYLGKDYRLMYGAGFLARVIEPVWISLNAGYGWKGKYAWDEFTDALAVSDYLRGFDCGIDIVLFFESYYFSAGYETIPHGFSTGKPVHEISFTIGIKL